jgi:lipopolysaccharide export system protein LptC
LRRLLALAALVTGCAVKPSPTQMAPEVTLHQVRLRNFHNSTLSAVGTSSLIEYHRASADVDFQDLKLDVFRTEPPSPPGVVPPATHLEAPRAVGNLLSRVVQVTDGVTVRLPTGVVARTPQASFNSAEQRASGSSKLQVVGPDGFWLRADGFDLQLRTDVYDFVRPETRTRGP